MDTLIYTFQKAGDVKLNIHQNKIFCNLNSKNHRYAGLIVHAEILRYF